MAILRRTPNTKEAFGVMLLLGIVAMGGWRLAFTCWSQQSTSQLLVRRSLLAKAHNYKRFFSFPEVDFSSRFPSGHLESVIQTGPKSFAVRVGADPGPRRKGSANRNWFYFRVTNKAQRQHLQFEVRNLRHSWAVWKNGLALAYRSTRRNRWKLLRRHTELTLKRRSLRVRFDYTLRHGESVEFVLTFPYTRARLSRFLSEMERKVVSLPKLHFSREVLTLSALGYPVEMIRLSSVKHLTRFAFPRLKNLFPVRKATATTRLFSRRKCNIVLSARVHPAESAASYMLEGLLRYVVENSDQPEMAQLLEECVITAVPMLNPDGVELGFTRTDLAGRNLNAIYQQADINTPTIYALRKVVRYLDAQSSIRLFLDFHTHATKRGFFLFGNPLRRATYRSTLRFPFLLRRVDPRFMLTASGFGTDKFGYTSRREFGNKAQVQSVFTIESNYWGPDADLRRLRRAGLIRGRVRTVSQHFEFYNCGDFRAFGASVGKAMLALITGVDPAAERKLEAGMDRYFARRHRR